MRRNSVLPGLGFSLDPVTQADTIKQCCNFSTYYLADRDMYYLVIKDGGLYWRRRSREYRAENLPQNPPYCTNLQIPTNSEGMPPDPLNLSFPFAQSQILIYKQYSQALISKIHQQSKILTPSFKRSWDRALNCLK